MVILISIRAKHWHEGDFLVVLVIQQGTVVGEMLLWLSRRDLRPSPFENQFNVLLTFDVLAVDHDLDKAACKV
ncbi:hypothetical protein WG66_016455 [Moniliophthora roreri]|nr:hypothetical protein WG66_016455 [Moniliophthora roreri]